jgi:hypothetical protein
VYFTLKLSTAQFYKYQNLKKPNFNVLWPCDRPALKIIKLTAVIKRKCVFVLHHTDFSAPKSENAFEAAAAPTAAAAAAAVAAFVIVVITILHHVSTEIYQRIDSRAEFLSSVAAIQEFAQKQCKTFLSDTDSVHIGQE